MDFEDTEDKLRRNVVLISTLILLFWFLGLEIPKSLFGFDIKSTEHGKVWWFVAIALTYIFFRFFHTDEAVGARKEVRNERFRFVNRCVMFGFAKSLQIYKRFGFSPLFDTDFIKERAEALLSREPAPASEILGYQPNSPGYHKQDDENLYFSVIIDFAYETGVVSNESVESVRKPWPIWFRFMIWVGSYLYIATRTKNIVNVYVPYVLFSSAAVVLILKLIAFYK